MLSSEKSRNDLLSRLVRTLWSGGKADSRSATRRGGVALGVEQLEVRQLLSGVPASLPGAPATLFLDFDGHYQALHAIDKDHAIHDIHTKAFTVDANPSLSPFEKTTIENIRLRVAEMYAPFNINVTTIDPGSYAQKEVAVVAIGESIAREGTLVDLTKSQATGLAHVYGFSEAGRSNVGFVMSDFLLRNVPRDYNADELEDVLAATIAHESGHLFGLAHQSKWDVTDPSNPKLVEEYRAGDAHKSPIMGNTLLRTDRNVWSNGPTEHFPTVFQDDLATIAKDRNGFGYRVTGVGHDLNSATSWGALTDRTVEGVIVPKAGFDGSKTLDDYYSFTTLGGDLTATLILPEYSTLRARVTLLDSAGTEVSSEWMKEVGGAIVLVKELTAGKYFIKVSSFGEYGDVGSYSLNAHLSAARDAKLVLLTISLPAKVSEEIEHTFAVTTSSGRPPADYRGTVQFTSSDKGAKLPPNYTFKGDGGWDMSTFKFTFSKPGKHTVTLTDITGRAESCTFTVLVSANPTKFRIDAPWSAVAGAGFGVTVTAMDDGGNVVTDYTGTMRFSSSEQAAGLPAEYTFTHADRGTHTFSGISFATTGTKTITARDSKLGFSAQADIDVVPGSFRIITPATTLPGTAFDATITVLDANGKVLTGYTGTILFGSFDKTAVLPAPYTFTFADRGTRTFKVTLNTPGTHTIGVADSAGGVSSISKDIDVKSVVVQYGISAPSVATAGSSFDISVMALDANGKVVTNYLGTVRFSSSDKAAGLPAEYTFTAADAGIHKFTRAATLKTTGNQTITVVDKASNVIKASKTITVNSAQTSIKEKYQSLGGASSFLGSAKGTEQNSSNGGKYQLYEHGLIYWFSATGAQAVGDKNLGDVAFALKSTLNLSLTSVAGALWSMGYNTRTQVVSALVKGIGGKYADMGNAVLNGISGSTLASVAYALKNGTSLSLTGVARALWDMGGNTRTEVMEGLVKGIGGKYADFGNAILNGISGSTLASVAYALKNGTSLNLTGVARALWDMGGNTRTEVMEGLVKGIGGKYADFGNAILNGISGSTLAGVAYALNNGTSLSLTGVARALWDMGSNTRTEVVGALVKGIGGKYADMASAVLKGISGSTLANVAYALKNGAGISVSSVARALWDMGGNSRSSIINALVSGLSVSRSEAQRIVNAL